MRAGGELATGVMPGGEYGVQGPASSAWPHRGKTPGDLRITNKPEAKENNLSGGNHGGERTVGSTFTPISFLSHYGPGLGGILDDRAARRRRAERTRNYKYVRHSNVGVAH